MKFCILLSEILHVPGLWNLRALKFVHKSRDRLYIDQLIILFSLKTIYSAESKANFSELLRINSDCVFSGGTERSIIRDLLTANNVPYHDSLAEREKINELYKTRFEEALDRKDVEYQPLPGVLPLLEKCSKSSEVDLAIVTGNLLHCAELKLKSAGIDSEMFKKSHEGSFKLIGGFGDDDIHRPGLVSAAISRFNLFYDMEISPDQFLVIGDTPKDIHCAHANDVPGTNFYFKILSA